MKHALALLAAILAVFLLSLGLLGYQSTFKLGYGTITIMSALISLTFLWLWHERTTSLALGMAFSWAGTTSIMGWWWAYNLFDRPPAMFQHDLLFLFLSLHIVGAVLHFVVMQRSMGYGHGAFVLPIGASVLLSALALMVL